MSWKTLIEKTQADAYKLPDGWETRDAIAEEMGCSSDNVRKLLQPALKSGAVEFKQLPIWDEVSKRIKSVACYRQLPKPAKK